ncbi:MAG: hypothetical protein AB7G28_08050 [Pirellulales bacterium]
MKPAILILTALHVLAHGVFGCCDHGALAAAQSSPPCVCHRTDHEHAHPSHAPVKSGDRIEKHSPSPAPHECVHASCHWLTGSAGQTIVPPLASMPLALGTASPVSLLAVHAAEFRPADTAASSLAPPLRLHLALGVILV